MGRELKRVSMNFDWPLGVVWKGYCSPYHPTKCSLCGGSGLNPKTKKLSDDWYTHLRTDGKRGWREHLEQPEVDTLWNEGRLRNFEEKPTAEQVNLWARRGLGHDSINQWICVKSKAKRLGFYGLCPLCHGNGSYFCEDKYEELSNEWKPIDPPEGEGYQLWETVSEGSPISPVFATKEDFLGYLLKEGYSEKAAICFIDSGWVPSMSIINGKLKSGIEQAADFPKCSANQED